MASKTSSTNESKNEELETMISSLPKEKGWWLETIYKYEGYWFDKPLLEGTLIAQQSFKARSDTVVLVTLPKSGTTWFQSLLFTIMNRTHYDYSTHPLLTSSPHDCVPSFEFANDNLTSFPRLVCAHIPFPLLPESVKNPSSSCRVVYVCRDPKDVFVSLWHFTNKIRSKELPPLGIEEAFDLYCQGVSPFGSYWDHVLEYWKASVLMPNKVLFLKYEDMKSQPIAILKRVAEFVGCAFSYNEEQDGVIQKIVDFCSFESLTSFQVNQTPTRRSTMPGTNMSNNMFFRKGEVGDYKNYMTREMIVRLKEITDKSFKDTGLQLYGDVDA